MDKMLSFLFLRVVGVPITPDTKACFGSLLDGNNVWQGDACRIAVFVHIFVSGEVQLDVHFQNLVSIILSGGKTEFLGDFLLNIVLSIERFAQILVHIEAGYLQFA